MADNTPTSDVAVCNLALDELKIDGVESLDQKDKAEAELCKRHYDLTRKSILRSHVWNFAKSEGVLNRSSVATSNSYADVYPLPAGFIRFISIGDVFVWDKDDDYDIRSISIDGTFTRCVVINNGSNATLDIMYIRNVTNVAEFDPLFIEYFKFKLAKAIAPGLTLKQSLKDGIKEGLADAMLQARSIDGQERPPRRIQNSRFLNARKFASRQPPVVTTKFGS